MSDVTWWHGSTSPVAEVRPYLHVGTEAQARMRAGRGCHLLKVTLGQGRTVRRRDVGSWKEQDLRRLAGQGFGLVVYLNRFEGIPIGEFDEARTRCRNIDLLPDSRFRRLLPSAAESMIVLDPALALIVA